MLIRKATSVALLSILLTATVVQAEKATELKPTLSKLANVILDESFSSGELDTNWAANKGTWEIKESVVVGREKKEDMHAAVLTLKQPHRNSIIRFSFQLDGARGFNLSFNHAKGHLFRVTIAKSGLTLIKDKNKKDPNSKPIALANASGKFNSGQWHTLLVETRGDKIAVQCDNGAKLSIQEQTLDTDKTGYRFVMRGESLLLDDIKVWNVE